MNKKQKITLKIFIIVLAVMVLFPITYNAGHMKPATDNEQVVMGNNYKYMFISTLLSQQLYGKFVYNIHVGLYLIQILLISLIFSNIFLLNKE